MGLALARYHLRGRGICSPALASGGPCLESTKSGTRVSHTCTPELREGAHVKVANARLECDDRDYWHGCFFGGVREACDWAEGESGGSGRQRWLESFAVEVRLADDGARLQWETWATEGRKRAGATQWLGISWTVMALCLHPKSKIVAENGAPGARAKTFLDCRGSIVIAGEVRTDLRSRVHSAKTPFTYVFTCPLR